MKKSGHQHEPELAFGGSRRSKTQDANKHGSSAAEKERKKKLVNTSAAGWNCLHLSCNVFVGSWGATKYKSEAYSTTGINSDWGGSCSSATA